jgi:DNA-binding transcriptional LysR family regulator
VELRDIEIFLTLADELHFGRTAERLHVSQARVSQAIKAQERRIGGELFERTSRRVALTPLGEQLRDDLRPAYDGIGAAIARAVSTAGNVSGTLRLGVMGNDGLRFLDVIERFRSENPGCELEWHEIHFSNAFDALRRGEVDVAAVWSPVSAPDLVAGPVLFTVGRVLMVATDHELARRPSVSMEVLADHVVVDAGPVPGAWLEAMIPARTPAGRPITCDGPRATTFHEVLALVASGACVSPAGAQAARYGAHAEVVFVPIDDAPPLDWVLTWCASVESPMIRAFARAARVVGAARPSGALSSGGGPD